MKKVLVWFSVSAIVCELSCTDDTPVPNPHQPYVPTNKVTAIVDGQPWEDFAPLPYSSVFAQEYPGNFFQLEADNSYGSSYSSIYLKVYSLNDTGYYFLNDLNIGRYHTDNPVEKTYLTDINLMGYFHVTKFDTADQKISGEFAFTACDTLHDDTISVSSGRIYNVSYIH